MGSALPALADSRACAWSPERRSRQTVQGQRSSGRMVPAFSNSPAAVAPFRQSESRPICVKRQRSLPNVLFKERRRAGPSMAQFPTVRFSPDLAVTTGNQVNQEDWPLGGPHSSAMGEPNLVPRADAAVTCSPMADSGEERSSLSSRRLNLASSSRALVSACMDNQRIPVVLPEGVVNTITQSRAPSTGLWGALFPSRATEKRQDPFHAQSICCGHCSVRKLEALPVNRKERVRHPLP